MKTVDLRSDLQTSSCGMAANPLRLALPDPSIDRRSYAQPDVRKALFLTLSKALQLGMIGHDTDFFRKRLCEVEGHLSLSDKYEAKV